MSGRRTAFKLVNDAHEVAGRFSVGDRVSLSYTSDSYPGIVTKVEADIGKVWVDFSGNVKQMDPFEIRHDANEVVQIEEDEVFTGSTRRSRHMPSQKRQAIYHIQPGRHYKLTRQEQDQGTAFCPRCHAEMNKAPFARGVQLFDCPDCSFKITTDHVFDAEYRTPSPDDTECAEEDMGDTLESDPEMMASVKTAGGEQLMERYISSLKEIQQKTAELFNKAAEEQAQLGIQAAALEAKIKGLFKFGPYGKLAVRLLEKYGIDTGSMGSDCVDTIEKLSGVTVYPPNWPIDRSNYALVTAASKSVTAAAGPYTLLQQLLEDHRRGLLDNDDHLRMIGNGWGHTPGADYIFGSAAEDIVWALLGFAAERKDGDTVRNVIKKNLDQALRDNEPFKGLRGEQSETRELWHRLMESRRNGLRSED